MAASVYVCVCLCVCFTSEQLLLWLCNCNTFNVRTVHTLSNGIFNVNRCNCEIAPHHNWNIFQRERERERTNKKWCTTSKQMCIVHTCSEENKRTANDVVGKENRCPKYKLNKEQTKEGKRTKEMTTIILNAMHFACTMWCLPSDGWASSRAATTFGSIEFTQWQ